jgi:hypothetical protein
MPETHQILAPGTVDWHFDPFEAYDAAVFTLEVVVAGRTHGLIHILLNQMR